MTVTDSRGTFLKQAAYGLLICLFILALSSRTYSAWRKGYDHDPVQHPWTIMAGESLAPHQYRVLFPVMWQGLSQVLEAGLADKVLLFMTIVGCYTTLFFIYRSLMKNTALVSLALLAFLGTCMHPYQFQFRDTFLEITLISLAFYLQSRVDQRPAIWNGLALLSFIGTLNRETWIFVLSGCMLAQCGKGWRHLWTTKEGRVALAGIVKMTLATGLAVGLTRCAFGIRPYYCRIWTWNENLYHIFFWRLPGFTFGHGIWGVGAGIFLVYLATWANGNRHQRMFILGYVLPLLLVSFLLIARWMESRTFFPAFAIVIGSIGMHIHAGLTARSRSRSDMN